MKNVFKYLGVIAMVAMMAAAFTGCPNDPDDSGPKGSGKYTGKDVLGNKYTLSVGKNSNRSAVVGERYTMEITTRDGATRYVSGTVTGINDDGTLTLKPDAAGAEEFTAVVEGNGLTSVVGQDIPFTGTGGAENRDITPRTFETIYLEAIRWDNTDNPNEDIKAHGESWGSNLSVLVKDFPTNVSKWDADEAGRYTITISGTSNVDIDYGKIEVQGYDKNGDWASMAETSTETYLKIKANTPFNAVLPLTVWHPRNLMEFDEIILQVVNEFKNIAYDDTWHRDNGSIPADVADGDRMATISNFNIVLKDTEKAALAGNMGDYTYGYQADGLSIAYQQAVWSLSAENVALAKVPGAKFEFFLTDFDDDIDTSAVPAIGFAWQDPARELWWNDEWWNNENDNKHILDWNNGGVSGKTIHDFLREGVSWDSYRKKVSIDLATYIESNQFASAQSLNFIIGYWWDGEKDAENVDDLGIAGGNIVEAVPDVTGNLGKYTYGYTGTVIGGKDGITLNYGQAVWHLTDDVLVTAQEPGAKLVIVFGKDIEKLTFTHPKEGPQTDQTACLALVWQGIDTERWWPNDTEAGMNENGDAVNLMVFGRWDGENHLNKDGVIYNSETKTLTVPLAQALETYDGFTEAKDVNFALECWWGIANSINELDIKSANIVIPE